MLVRYVEIKIFILFFLENLKGLFEIFLDRLITRSHRLSRVLVLTLEQCLSVLINVPTVGHILKTSQ